MLAWSEGGNGGIGQPQNHLNGQERQDRNNLLAGLFNFSGWSSGVTDLQNSGCYSPEPGRTGSYTTIVGNPVPKGPCVFSYFSLTLQQGNSHGQYQRPWSTFESPLFSHVQPGTNKPTRLISCSAATLLSRILMALT